MPKVLVVDDDPHKIRQLAGCVRDEYPHAEVIERKSYQSGLKAALLDSPDLIILDMTMPTYDVGGKEVGGRERRYAGHQILRQLRRKNSNAQVIIVTQFEKFGEGKDLVTLDELKIQLRNEFDDRYLGVVFYQAADSRWKHELCGMMSKCHLA